MAVCSVCVFVMLPGNCSHIENSSIVLPYEDHFLSMIQTLCHVSVQTKPVK